jgi:hypothetical protein
VRIASLALLLACRHPAVAVEPPATVTMPIADATVDPAVAGPAEPTAIPVELEVTARIVEVKLDKATGTSIVTVGAGSNQGVRGDWTASVVDDTGAVLGTVILIDVTARTTTGASALAPDKLDGKRVRLATPTR